MAIVTRHTAVCDRCSCGIEIGRPQAIPDGWVLLEWQTATRSDTDALRRLFCTSCFRIVESAMKSPGVLPARRAPEDG